MAFSLSYAHSNLKLLRSKNWKPMAAYEKAQIWDRTVLGLKNLFLNYSFRIVLCSFHRKIEHKPHAHKGKNTSTKLVVGTKAVWTIYVYELLCLMNVKSRYTWSREDFSLRLLALLLSRMASLWQAFLRNPVVLSSMPFGWATSALLSRRNVVRASQGERRQLLPSSLHPTNQRCWLDSSLQSAHSAGTSCRLSLFS